MCSGGFPLRSPLLVATWFFILLLPSLVYSQSSLTPIITDVVIEGNANAEETLIRSVSTIKKDNIFNARDVSTTIKALYRLGLFEDVRILGTAQRNNGVLLTISVREYPLLDRIEFEGNKKIKKKELERIAGIFQGQAVSPFRRKFVVDRIVKEYNKKGYLLAKVEDALLVEQNNGILRLTIQEGKKVKLGQIYVEGNTALTDKKLVKAIKKKDRTENEHFWKEGDLRRERLMDQFEKVTREYRKNGFRNARVIGDSLWFSENKERMHMSIVVDEGRQYYLGDVTFNGNTIFNEKQLGSLMQIDPGKPFNDEKYQESLAKIYEAYGELGYLYANPLARETVVEDSLIQVQVTMNEGKPANVHRVHIIGNTKTKDKVIRREMIMKPGQIFRRSALLRSQRDIFQLNFFQDVQPDITPLPDGDVDVTMTVQEKPTGTANAGAGFSGLDGLVGTISVLIPNFLGNGQTVNFGWEFGARRNSISMGFTEPWLFDTPTSAGIDLFRTVRFWFGDFRVRQTGFTLSVGRRIRNTYFRVGGNYQFFNLRYTDFRGPFFPDFKDEDGHPAADPILVKQREDLLKNSGLTSSISTNLTRDSRDFPQFATRGSRNSVENTLAGVGGDVKYFKQVYNSDWYLPVFGGTALSFRSRYGLISNPFNNREEPFFERFFPGGVSFDGSIRGYSNNSIGPHTAQRDSTGNLIGSFREGGRSMMIFTLEYTIPIVDQRKSPQPVYALVFAEAGNAWRRISETSIKPRDLKKSVGFGIRVMMPLVGLMGFDFGYGFDRPSDPIYRQFNKRSGWNTHFQLGQFF